MSVKIVAVSDTHALHKAIAIPDGDILVHAGDMTRNGAFKDVQAFNDYLGTLPHRYKIVIAGNHDFCFERNNKGARELLSHAIYLQDEAVTIEGIHFYGSPWQPRFFDWAFNLDRGAALRAKWELIPPDTDVLITHGPPFGQGDRSCHGECVGCVDLLEFVEKIRPRLHIFGHIHEAVGVTHNAHTTFINASSCNLAYKPVNLPVVYEYA